MPLLLRLWPRWRLVLVGTTTLLLCRELGCSVAADTPSSSRAVSAPIVPSGASKVHVLDVTNAVTQDKAHHRLHSRLLRRVDRRVFPPEDVRPLTADEKVMLVEENMLVDPGLVAGSAASNRSEHRAPVATSLLEVAATSSIYSPGIQIQSGKVPWLDHPMGKCMATDGALLYVEDCYKGHKFKVPERQKWQWTERRLRNNAFPKLCITQPWHDIKTHGGVELVISDCDAGPNQKWFFDSFQRLKNEYEGENCMDTVKDQDKIFMNSCDGRNSQWFSYM